jgi:hypothetical protein
MAAAALATQLPRKGAQQASDLQEQAGSVVVGEGRHAQRLFSVIVGIVRLTCANALADIGCDRSPSTLLPRICHARVIR